MPKLAVIDLTDGEQEAQVAIRHPDGNVLVLTMKAHRNIVTVCVPAHAVLGERENSGDMTLS